MAPGLPSSLSPHTCVLPSQDLIDLLASSSLPPLPQILQSFSPLPQVTTRTTTLTPVPHASFALRFSNLVEIEEGCREDEEQRAARTIDWISARISRRCAKWVEDWERVGAAAAEKEGAANLRTPWWDEVRHCVEGDHIPSKVEGWNHPVAVILAVSTMAPNPLQALAQLHARPPEFPSWVDGTQLRYSLIIHPKNSPLSDEEAGALFNAVKKQYGLQSFLLPLELPSPAPPPVPVPMTPPRLPPVPTGTDTPDPSKGPLSPGLNAGPGLAMGLNTLRFNEHDIQQTARFVREFVAMSLVPWMEKCVVEWNENFSSTRRLPSRLFSSTRRFFGSANPSPTPSHGQTSSISSVTARTRSGSQTSISSLNGGPAPPPQQRRLAEFATILGDLKLAASVWEALRKDGKGGSEILPMLLAPSPAVPLHVNHALSTLMASNTDSSALTQFRALVYAVRWDAGIEGSDFISNVLEGERWLVWAASSAEEPPSALLLAHAAYLSVRKQARRRAALWYLFAANRLEKSGIKPLTMYFLRRAHDLYTVLPEKTLSPSFWDSEGVDPGNRVSFEAILPGIEHALGRLHYTTGDVRAAVRFFLLLLRGSANTSDTTLLTAPNGHPIEMPKSVVSDRVFLEDFRVAFQHLQDTTGGKPEQGDLKLPLSFCDASHTRLRLPGDSVGGDGAVWDAREDGWRTFWRAHGKETLQSTGKAAVNEAFWIDLAMRNPLDVDVNLANLTVVVRESGDNAPSADFVEVEVVDDIILGAMETRTIPLSVRSKRSSKLFISHASYDFLSLLPTTEPLTTRGRRLQDTPLQRQGKVYAPDVALEADVEDASQRLSVDFVDDGRLVLEHGECKRMRLWVSNIGTEAVDDIWLVAGPEDEFWLDKANGQDEVTASATEVLHSSNSLAQRLPQQIPLDAIDGNSLSPGNSFEIPFVVHASAVGDQELCLLFVYRQKEQNTFHCTRATRVFEVRSLLSVATTYGPSRELDNLLLLNLDIRSISTSSVVTVSQVTTVSPTWSCTTATSHKLGNLLPSQAIYLPLGVRPWAHMSDNTATRQFVTGKLRDVLQGRDIDQSDPPAIELLCSHVSYTSKTIPYSVLQPSVTELMHQGRRNIVSSNLSAVHPNVPPQLHRSIFSLYHPHSVDIILFWDIPSEGRSGHILITGPTLGAGHGALNDIIQEAEEMKVKRSMYAETQREKSTVLEAIRSSEWNAEMNPIVVSMHDSGLVEHDFSHSPCHVPVPATLRNYSLTHQAKYTLKLGVDISSDASRDDLAQPSWVGRLTYRGTLEPLQHVTVRPTLHVARPDTYSLGGWQLETEVGQEPRPSQDRNWRTKYRYLEGPSSQSCITVVDTSHV